MSTFFSSDSWFLEHRNLVFHLCVSKEYGQASGPQWTSMERLSGWLKLPCLSMPTPEPTYIVRGWYIFSPGRCPLGLGTFLQVLCSSTEQCDSTENRGNIGQGDPSFHQGWCIAEAGSPHSRVGLQDTGGSRAKERREHTLKPSSLAPIPAPLPTVCVIWGKLFSLLRPQIFFHMKNRGNRICLYRDVIRLGMVSDMQ